jgi:glycosyltransferase involved in cell wall biosynthesis
VKLLFVADGRSAIALNWIGYFVARGDEVHLASTFPCRSELRLASLHVLDVAFSRVKGGNQGAARAPRPGVWGARTMRLRTSLRQWLGPLTLRPAAAHLAEIAAGIKPDLVHAMRIPYEGMAAALARPEAPLLVSTWGNDFTLHAPSTPIMGRLTRKVLQTADGLHADCRRDVRLALAWGYPPGRPAVVLPGAGGVQSELFFPAENGMQAGSAKRVINPRGFRAYVRNDSFFQSIPLVLEKEPEARFLCPGMAGERQAQIWVKELRLEGVVELLPQVSRPEMAKLFRSAQVAVSPSIHDGTPNTLLEAMACGCFPVAGDLESLREWITPGVNGLLVDAGQARSLAEGILLALGKPDLRARAARQNQILVSERAEHRRVMAQAVNFYQELLDIRP